MGEPHEGKSQSDDPAKRRPERLDCPCLSFYVPRPPYANMPRTEPGPGCTEPALFPVRGRRLRSGPRVFPRLRLSYPFPSQRLRRHRARGPVHQTRSPRAAAPEASRPAHSRRSRTPPGPPRPSPATDPGRRPSSPALPARRARSQHARPAALPRSPRSPPPAPAAASRAEQPPPPPRTPRPARPPCARRSRPAPLPAASGRVPQGRGLIGGVRESGVRAPGAGEWRRQERARRKMAAAMLGPGPVCAQRAVAAARPRRQH